MQVRVQALICLGKLLPNLEPWMVSGQLIPALPKVNSKEPGVLMAILGIYKLVHDNEKFGISKDQCAKSALPFLISMCVENTLNLTQFEQFMALIHQMLNKVEKEQRHRLQQLTASQEEQRQIPDFTDIIGKKDASNVVPKTNDFPLLTGTQYSGDAVTTTKISSGRLTLEDKKRLAAEQEQNLRLRNQSPISQQLGSNNASPLTKDSTSKSVLDSMLSLDGNSSAPMTGVLSPSVRSSPSLKSNSPIDISEFLPKTNSNFSNTNVVPTSFPSGSASVFPAFSQTSNTQGLFEGSMAFNSVSSVGLPKPPRSTNPVVRNNAQNIVGTGFSTAFTSHSAAPRNKPDLSAFDSLLTFPSSNISFGNSKELKPNSNIVSKNHSKQFLQSKDPFADLLG